jgi:plasmid stabilization system protein ParE
MTHVVFAPDALRDIIEMQRYFSAAGSARAADRYIDDVVRACLDLVGFPNRGAQRDTVTPDVRFLHHQRRCTIAYKVGDHASVTIIGIFYGDVTTAICSGSPCPNTGSPFIGRLQQSLPRA